METLFLKISQISHENGCVCKFKQKTLRGMCFPANFAKYLKAPIFAEHIRSGGCFCVIHNKIFASEKKNLIRVVDKVMLLIKSVGELHP